jgi:GNAT superfamily N-acetyltransferase
MDCGGARVQEIPHQRPTYDRYLPARLKVVEAAQQQVYLPFMGRQILDQFLGGDFAPSWNEGSVAHFFNAYVGSEVVGVTDLMTQPDNWRLVEPMYVLPECQGKGVGRKLWEACRAAAIGDGAKGLRVVALKQNDVANRFYSVTLRLPEVGAETLNVGQRIFPAIKYEIALP